jgi:TonB family protein
VIVSGVVVIRLLGWPIVLFVAVVSTAAAQGPNRSSDEKCDGAVYEAKDVSQKARIRDKPIPKYTEAGRKHNVNGTVALTAILCRSGQVTDIQVVKGLPYGLTESAIDAAKGIKFEPAQKDAEAVSQKTQLEYSFSVGPPRALAKEPVEGRMVERTVVWNACRYRAEITREIWAKIKTRVNGPFNKEQANSDLDGILTLGYFDKQQSHLRFEEGDKGGIHVVFVLKELPQQDLCEK